MPIEIKPEGNWNKAVLGEPGKGMGFISPTYPNPLECCEGHWDEARQQWEFTPDCIEFQNACPLCGNPGALKAGHCSKCVGQA